MADTSSTTTFRADISNLRAEMQAASRAVKVANSEFKAATAGMDDWSASADGLEAKIKQLNSVLKAQNKQVELAAEELSKVEAEYGKNSAEADRARIKYNNFKAAATQTQKALDQYEKELKDTKSETDDLGAATAKTGDGFTVFKGIISDLASSALKAGMRALKDFGKYVIDVGSTFEQSMSEVEAVSGASGDALTQMETKAKELGSTTKFTAAEVADGFKYMALAGWDTADSLTAIDSVINLAAASGMDLGRASDMVTDYLAAFGLEAEDSAKMVDELVYAQSHSNTSTEQLGEAFGNAAANMNAAGQSMETTIAVLEAMANQGTRGSEAGTALSAVMRDITQRMDEGTISIGNTSLAVMDSEGNFRSLTDILADVEAATKGMGSAERASALQKTFTARSIKAVNQVLNEGTDAVKSYQKALEESDGAAQKTADTMMDNFSGSVTKAKSAMEGLGVAVFDLISGPASSIVDVFTDATAALTDFLTPKKSDLENYLDQVNSRLKETKAEIDGIGDIELKANADISSIEAYRDVLEKATKGEELSEFEKYKLKAAVDSLSGVIPGLADAYDEETSSINMTYDAMLNLLDSTEKQIKMAAYQEAIESAYKSAADATLVAAEAQSAYEEATKQLSAVMADIPKEAKELIENGADASAVANEYTGITAEQANELVRLQAEQDKAAKTLEEATAAQTEAEEAAQKKVDVLKKLKDEEESGTQTTEENTEAVEDNADAISELSDETEEYADTAAMSMNKALDAQKEGLRSLREAFQSNYDSIRNAVSQKISLFDAFDGGKDITVEEMLSNLQSQTAGILQYKQEMEEVIATYGDQLGPDLVNTLQNMGADAANTWHHMWVTMSQDNAPELFAQIGEEWSKGLDLSDQIAKYASGSLTAYELATNKLGSTKIEWTGLRESVTEMTPELDAAIAAAEAAGVKIPQGLASGLESGETDAAAAVDILTGALQGTFESLYEIAQTSGADIPAGLSAGMEGSAEEYQAAIGQLTEALSTAGNEAGAAAADEISTGLSDNTTTVETAASDTAGAAAEAADGESDQFKSAGSAAADEFVKAIESKQTLANTTGKTLANAAKSGADTVDMTPSGMQFAQGYINGINNLIGAVIAKAREMVRSAINAAKAAQQEGSPSKLTYKSGVNFVKGYINGIASQQKLLQKGVSNMVALAIKELAKMSNYDFTKVAENASVAFSTAMTDRVEYMISRMRYENEAKLEDFDKTVSKLEKTRDKKISAAEKARDKKIAALQDKYDKTRDKNEKTKIKKQINAEKARAKKQINQIEKNYEKLINTQKKYKDAYSTASSEMISELRDTLGSYQDAAQQLIDDTINGITDSYDERYNTLIGKQDSLIDKLRNAADLFTVSNAGVMVIGDIQEQTRQIREYTQKLKSIKDQVSSELFDQITEYDMQEGAAFLDRLLAMSAEDLSAYNTAFTEKMQAAQEAADEIYKSDFEQISKDYEAEINSAFKDIPAQLEEMGAQALKGFVSGLTSNTDYMSKQIKTFISAMVGQFKSQLQIASPSRVMFSLGEFTGEGFADGLKSIMADIKSVTAGIVNEVKQPLTGMDADLSGVAGSLVQGTRELTNRTSSSRIVNNYNLVQNNTSPKALSALETYQARRRQIALVKAFS